MTTLKKQTEIMHARLDKVASNEQRLVEALSDALARADQKLLDDVRGVTIEHETRRALILSELHTLASRIGAFAASTQPSALLNDDVLELDDALDLPYYVPDETPPEHTNPAPMPKTQTNGHQRPSTRGGDWRKATKNICEDWGIPVNGSEPAT